MYLKLWIWAFGIVLGKLELSSQMCFSEWPRPHCFTGPTQKMRMMCQHRGSHTCLHIRIIWRFLKITFQSPGCTPDQLNLDLYGWESGLFWSPRQFPGIGKFGVHCSQDEQGGYGGGGVLLWGSYLWVGTQERRRLITRKLLGKETWKISACITAWSGCLCRKTEVCAAKF